MADGSHLSQRPARVRDLPWHEQTALFMPHSLTILTLREDKIEEITAFLTPDPFPHFALPASIAA